MNKQSPVSMSSSSSTRSKHRSPRRSSPRSTPPTPSPLPFLFHAEQPLHTFLFMGCWNKDGCQPGTPQYAVTRALLHEDPTLPLLLAGDNVYPDKTVAVTAAAATNSPKKSTKRYSLEKLDAGVQCLTPRTLLSALGNHNIADPAILAAEFADTRWFLPASYYVLQYTNKTAVIVLDSNVLDTSMTAEVDIMLAWLHDVLSHFSRTHVDYYLMMHHPLVSYKKRKVQILAGAAPLLAVLETHMPLLLLVADTHNYQKGQIAWRGTHRQRLQLIQIVSGTGGATLDSLESLGTPIASPLFSYTVLESAEAYGYQRIHGQTTEFVEVPT